MRKTLIAGNWKMNNDVEESIKLARSLKSSEMDKNVDVLICPPFTSIYAIIGELKNSSIKVGAQNMHFEDSGAFTGEISPSMLKNMGVEYVIIGHSERRQYFGETDQIVNKKIILIEGAKTQSRTLKDINSLHDKKKRTIMMVGHPYNIYDNYINMNLAYKLVKNNVKVITSETIDENKILFYSSKLPKRMFWTYGKRIIGSSFCAIEEGLCDGMIYISSFGCGMDSILVDLIERKAKEKMVPFMLITVDEQTGEAGINTRIEAFLDMMMWRDRDENNISTLG